MAKQVQQTHVDRVAAYAIKFVREVQGMSRQEFAERLSEETGDEWTEPMVHNLEGGRKTITAGILWAVSQVLGRPPGWFLTADSNDNTGFPETPSDLRELVA